MRLSRVLSWVGVWIIAMAFLPSQVMTSDKGQVMTLDKNSASTPLVVKSSIIKPKIMSLVVDVQGQGNRFLADEDSFALIPGKLVPSKGLFMVPPLGRVIFRPMPGITTLIAEDSKLQMKGLDVVKRGSIIKKRKAYLYLNEGNVYTSIQRLNNKTTTYEIETPQAVAGAKGTKFWVSYRNGKGKIGVINGVVTVRLTGGNKGTITLVQNQFIDMAGVGSELKTSDVRIPTAEEIKMSEEAAEAVAKGEGVTSSTVNPFLTTTEATNTKDNEIFESGFAEPIIDSSTANTNNTSTNVVVSPTGP